jgi:Domain of Unknown Function (DUF1259)
VLLPGLFIGFGRRFESSGLLNLRWPSGTTPGDEVNPVIKALRSNGIEVTAVHNHMLSEQPRLFFLHFWANDDAVKLAKGLRAALDKTASDKS